MSGITTHILNVANGFPASAVPVRLERCAGEEWDLLSETVTDGDGRARLYPADEVLTPGDYRITFDTLAYFTASDSEGFYPTVQIVFTVRDERHHHVPLLLSPFGYSTYRGS